MIDFHSHILPYMDDGAESIEVSLAMLEESARQGVDMVFASSHFYADEDDPASFLARRDYSYNLLKEAMAERGGYYPEIQLGAEILYFPGMSVAEELVHMKMGCTPCLLVEPPMIRWTDSMLDEIEETGANLHCVPVIAHVDRYMRVMEDSSLIERLKDRRLLVQVNSNFFIRRESVAVAMEYLHSGRIHFIGSDCHNLDSRPPNIGRAAEIIGRMGEKEAFAKLNKRLYDFICTYS